MTLPAAMALTAAALLSAGCIVVPVHSRVVLGPAGEGRARVFQILQDPKATPTLIRQKLDFIDTQAGNRRFFWGRFARKWDYYWLAAGGGQTAAVAKDGKFEDWRRFNLLIEFAEDGSIKRRKIVKDSRLFETLMPLVRLETRTNAPPALPSDCIVGWNELTKVRTSRPPGTEVGEDSVWVRLEGRHGQKMMHCKVELDPAAVVQLVAYLQARDRENLIKTH